MGDSTANTKPPASTATTGLGQPLYTTGEIAKRLGVTRDRVMYVIRTRSIEPTQRAGQYHLFDEAAIERIRTTLFPRDAVTSDSAPTA